ncbi:3-hydroxyacyl-CoA dehydrogenase family protein [Sporosarcina siberiensis]|uniref:3-hydroxyacyl-CoA dehydrogenase family protein n=1 Tax=Sporosarcina siberiensis TaxID=1365606 RepID=A0ABW4SHR4_9BACL
MKYDIKNVAVLGSGVMGSGIAAHLAAQGLSVLLLDRIPDKLTEQEREMSFSIDHMEVRNRFSINAINQLKQKNILSEESLCLIEVGNFDDDFMKLKEVDWIIEVVLEDLKVKKELFKKIDLIRLENTIISSNTSGLSINAMVQDCSKAFQKHFLGTHFFNPPYYLKLLEITPCENTCKEVLSYMTRFCKENLKKGVIIAKDTPNFIANRLGTYGLFIALIELEKGGYSVGEIDSVTGPLIGRPKSATLRTADVVGIDTLVLVAKYMHSQTEGVEKEMFKLPSFLKSMIDNGMLGAKKNSGFYKKVDKEIVELNVNSLEYGPMTKLQTSSVEQAMRQENVGSRIKTLIYSDDRAGQLVWNILSATLQYAGQLHGEIADDIVSMDKAMKWGFGWELGIFEIWDSIGIIKSVAKMNEEGKEIPLIVQQLLDKGYDSFYKVVDDKLYFFNGYEYALWFD